MAGFPEKGYDRRMDMYDEVVVRTIEDVRKSGFVPDMPKNRELDRLIEEFETKYL